MIIANMATFPARQEGLEGAVSRLAAQVDRLNLCLNEFDEVPEFLAGYPNVNPVIPERDLKDLGKFMFDADAEDDVFLVDDDLEYPVDYIQTSLEFRDENWPSRRGDGVFGYHGTIYIRPSAMRVTKDLIKRRGLLWSRLGRERKLYAYHEQQDDARIVAQLGTGVSFLKGRQMPPLDFMLGADRRADVRFARWALEKGFPMVSLPRQEGWIPRGGDDDHAIYKTYTSKRPKEFLREVLSFAFRVPDLDSSPGAV